jgi:hypothetical protein
MHGEMRNAYKILFGKPEGKRDNIKLDLKEIGLGVWTGFIWLREFLY